MCHASSRADGCGFTALRCYAAGAVLYFDVMADDDDGKKERKLCSLAVIKEELQEVLGRIVRDEEKR